MHCYCYRVYSVINWIRTTCVCVCLFALVELFVFFFFLRWPISRNPINFSLKYRIHSVWLFGHNSAFSIGRIFMCAVLMMTAVSMRLQLTFAHAHSPIRSHKWTNKLKQWCVCKCITFSMVGPFDSWISTPDVLVVVVVVFLSRFNIKYSGKLWA